MRIRVGLLSMLVATAAAAAPIQYRLVPETATLAEGGGAKLAEANCGTCHSFDYITTQQPQRGQAFWQAIATKMIKTYHAPIADTDGAAIADYLSKIY